MFLQGVRHAAETRADSVVESVQNAAAAVRGMAVAVVVAMIAVIATLILTVRKS